MCFTVQITVLLYKTQADELKIVLTAQEIELKKKNEIADKILVEVRAENTKAEGEKAIGEISESRRRSRAMIIETMRTK